MPSRRRRPGRSRAPGTARPPRPPRAPPDPRSPFAEKMSVIRRLHQTRTSAWQI